MRLLSIATTVTFLLCALMVLEPPTGYCETEDKDKDATATSAEVNPLARPLWEIGIGAAGARLPHYPGSDEYDNYVIPVAYVIYRGEILRADREGVRGIFYKGHGFETSLSFWGNPPISDDNEARQGMPELDAVGEVGPALRYYFYGYDHPDHLYLQAALRTAWSFDFQGGLDIDTSYEGLFGSLGMRFQNRTWLARQNIILRFNAALQFADNSYNDYFYGVDPAFATATRPAYEADGGYAGLSFSTSLYKRLTDRLGVGCYVRWNNISGAAFEDSPLVRTENNYSIGSVLIWRLFESKRSAP